MANKIRNVLIVILALMLVGLAVGLIIRSRNVSDPEEPAEPPAEPAAFTVAYGGESYTVSDGDKKISLPESGQAVFAVSGTESYTVKVVSKSYGIDPLNVYGLINGETYYVFDGKDYTDEFIAADNLHEDYFAIDCEENKYDLATLIKRIKNTDDFVIYNESGADMTYPYLLQVTSSDGEAIEIELNQTLIVKNQLKTPELSVSVTDVKTDEVTVTVSYGNIDGNADKAVLYGYVYGVTKAYENVLDGESGEYSLGLLLEAPWTFYIEVSDSTGKYLSAVSEQVEIDVGFLFEEVTETLMYSDVVPQSDSDDTAYTDYYVRVNDGQYMTGGVYLPAGYYRLYGHYLSGVYTFWILLRNGVNGTDYVLDDTTADTTSVWGYNVIYQVSTDDEFGIGLYRINSDAVAAS